LALVRSFKNSPAKWPGVPVPAEANVSGCFSVSALARSAIVEYGALAGTTSASGTTEASATGIRSFSAL